jgi:ferrochelatase
VKRIILLVAHGTVSSLEDLPAFLQEIRRGRPAPPPLIEEITRRYRAVGGSPLIEETRAQAGAVEAALGIPTRFAMRLWEPRVAQVLNDLRSDDEVILVPLAPYSVDVYTAAAREELKKWDAPPQLIAVAAWGSEAALIDGHISQIREAARTCPTETTRVVLTAHSLPLAVIRAGDNYDTQFRASAGAVAEKLSFETRIAYQSQGADGGEWLGPDLDETMKRAKAEGTTHLVVAPMGFLAEHVETLFDLDIEAKAKAEALGMRFLRVPTLSQHPGLVAAIGSSVQRALGA